MHVFVNAHRKWGSSLVEDEFQRLYVVIGGQFFVFGGIGKACLSGKRLRTKEGVYCRCKCSCVMWYAKKCFTMRLICREFSDLRRFAVQNMEVYA